MSDVCDRCGWPVVSTPSGWAHADNGDAVMCALLYPPAAPVRSDGE